MENANTPNPNLNELDPAKKNYQWANLVISKYRELSRPLNNWLRCGHNRMTAFSMQPLDRVRDSFDDEEFRKCTEFRPLPILEPLVNSVVEEIVKNPPKVELRATDPTSDTLRQQDLNMLQSRKVVEKDLTQLQMRVGDRTPEMGPYKVPDEHFEGNVGEFDKMGLNEDDSEDVNFYETSLQKLKFEIAGQSVINNVLKANQFDEITIRKIVKDIFALKTICSQAYVDQMTGAIRYKYIDPGTCFGIFGQTNDGKDDTCRGWDQIITIADWLGMVGNEFDWNRDWKMILWGLNYCGGTKFTGFIRGGFTYDCFGTDFQIAIGAGELQAPSLVDWGTVYAMKVYVGYIEWPTWEATDTTITNPKMPNFVQSVPYSEELSKKKMAEGYQKDSKYCQQWYRSYYIATTAISQWLFGFQKVYHQHIEGANDEFSNGTLCYYQEEGLSPVEVAHPYLETANFTFYRMLWLIYHTKPDAEEFIWEELTEMAKNTLKQYGQNNSNEAMPSMMETIHSIIKEQHAKHVRIRTYPTVEGRKVQNIHPIEKKGSGGLDPVAIAMQALTQWAENQIAIKIGINPARIGQADPQTDGYKLTMMQTQYSLATTGYMYRMVQYLKMHMATVTLNYAQDIAKFKDSAPYKWLLNMIGDEQMKNLKILDKFAAHRMGIFFGDYNTEADRQEIKQAATVDLQNGNIDITQWYLVTQQQDTKRAFALLAHYKIKQEKKKREDQASQNQFLQQMQQDKFQQEMQLEDKKGQYLLERAKIEANGFVASAQFNAQNKIDVEQLRQAAKVPEMDAKRNAEESVLQKEADLKAQEPLTSSSV